MTRALKVTAVAARRLSLRQWVGVAINVAGAFGAAHVVPPLL